jgi:thioredoxin 1
MIHVIEAEKIPEEIVRNSEKLMIIDFYAEWCEPCQMLAPILTELDKMFPDVEFFKVNVDEAEEFATVNGIQSIPTLLFYRDGEVKERVVGVTSLEKLSKIINIYKI